MAAQVDLTISLSQFSDRGRGTANPAHKVKGARSFGSSAHSGTVNICMYRNWMVATSHSCTGRRKHRKSFQRVDHVLQCRNIEDFLMLIMQQGDARNAHRRTSAVTCPCTSHTIRSLPRRSLQTYQFSLDVLETKSRSLRHLLMQWMALVEKKRDWSVVIVIADERCHADVVWLGLPLTLKAR